MRQAVRDAEIGPLRADRLVRVRLRNGRAAWVLIHIEVQSQPERAFARRMFDYYCRIRLHFGEEVVSLAVLADERASWRPDRYEEGRWGCLMDFRYPVVKLTDWRARRDVLEASENPFATVVLAHLAAQDTQGKVNERRRVKIEMIRRLFARGYSRARVLSLLRFIDWLLALPSTIEKEVRQEIVILEEGRKMAYVTSWERMSKAEGLEQGLAQGLAQGL
ncbi:MAG TPA: cytosolic protein, partial [Chloroflexota bacterium]|nr:cytosolic protein [Chloroflexota bacterium]